MTNKCNETPKERDDQPSYPYREQVRQAVAKAPPLSEEQKRRLAVLLVPYLPSGKS